MIYDIEEIRSIYKDLFEYSLDLIFVNKLNGDFLDANDITLNIFGYEKEDIPHYSLSDIMDKDQLIKAYNALKEIKKTGRQSKMMEFRLNGKDGSTIYVETYAIPLYKNGKIYATLGIARDITDLRKAQIKLERSEEQYRILFENSPYAIGLINKEGIIVYANSIIEKFSGYKREEFLGKKFVEFSVFSLEHTKIIMNSFKRLIKGEIPDPQELLLHKKDGSKIWVLIQASFLKLDNETLFQIITQDISTQKEASEKLKESEQKYRHLFENSPNMIILLDSNGRVLDANTTFLNVFSYKEEEIIGKNYQEFKYISLNNLPIYKEKFKNIFYDGAIEPFELRVEIKDEILRWMNIQCSLIDIEGRKLLQVIFQDINERKEAEQKLKESEEKYRIISENANDLITVINEKFRFEYINEEVHMRVTGYSKDDLIGKSPLNNFHPDDIKKGVKAWRDAVISGEGMTEFRYKKKDGTWIWLELRGKKFIDTNGEPKGIIISRDITKRKIAEQKLKESEQKYRHLFESSPYSIGLLDLDGTLLDGNEATNKFLSSRTKDELIGKNIREIFSSTEQDKSLLPKLTDYIKKVIKDEIREPLEIPITRSIGGVMWISFYGSLIKIGDKTLLQFLGQDITDRKRAEQNLKKSEEKYRLLFENSPNAIILANSKGIILDINHVYEKLFGFKRNELIGKNYTIISSPDHVKIMRKRYEDHLKGILLKPMEFEYSKGDGSNIWVNYQNQIIKLDDEDISISIIQDITKRKEAELLIKEELIKLKELEQIRKDLISRVSHELKTPLIPVLSGTELLATVYKDQIGKDMLEVIEMIDKGGSRLKKLIEKLITVSRIEYSKYEMNKKNHNLSEIINRSAIGMKFLMKQRSLKFNCDIPDNLYLEIDGLKLEEVITNLLSNAIKNTPPHGEINISLQKEENWATITVKDTGVGLTEKEMEMLFTRFGKIERYEKGLEDIDITGSGLGLYICKEIITLHEGIIWVESEGRNKGSRFTVKLPI